ICNLAAYENMRLMFFSFSPFFLFAWFDILLATISLFVIPYGFLNGRNWARIFAFVFLLESAFGAIIYIITTKEFIVRYPLFVVYVVSIMYLLMSPAQAYFGKTSKIHFYRDHKEAYTYEEYTLHSKDVNLKGGRTQTIYFFSKRTPKSGSPCGKPDNMVVGVNKRTGMPYLMKKKK
ncbi:MAG: hypothetical protein U9R21_05920, partial [Candidatus Thermoplasmatota archaeon]|nr:hypothetical protein [Candidatus Thermoplasmatota archaeon]